MVFVCTRCGNLSDSTRALNAHNRLCESVDTDRVDPINQTGLHSSTSIHENHFLKGMARFWDAFASSATVPEVEHSSHHDNNSSQFNIDNPAPISPDPRDDLNLPISNDSQDHQLSSENNIYQNNDVDSAPDEPPQQSGKCYFLYQSPQIQVFQISSIN